MKLPSFPRKALEAELDLFEGGSIGKVDVEAVYCLRLNQMAPLARSYRAWMCCTSSPGSDSSQGNSRQASSSHHRIVF